jgi:hypothetical protein
MPLRQSAAFAAFTLPISRFTAERDDRYPPTPSQHPATRPLMTLTRFSFAARAMTCAVVIGFAGAAAAQTAQSKPQAKRPAAAKPAKPAAKPAAAQASARPVGDPEPKLLGQYGEWGAYTASPDGKKLCFVLAKPGASETNPPNRPRDPAYLFVSTRPEEKVKEEVSLIIGYPLKPNVDVTATVGSTTFALYSQEDGAWIKNASEEDKMVDAMRKGADIVIKGESGRGTKTTDTFSLKGITQALERVGQECK